MPSTKSAKRSLSASHYSLYILSIILISFIILSKIFRDDLLVLGGDIFFPLDPATETYRSLFVWDTRWSTGIYNPRNIPSLFPFYSLLLFFRWSGLSLVVSQRILLGALFPISGVSMYFLTTTLLGSSRKKNVGAITAFVSAIFYMFNLYTLIQWAAPDVRYLSAYAGTPLFLALYVKGLVTRNFKYAIVGTIVSLLFASAASNPVFFSFMVIPILAYFIYHLVACFFRNNFKGLAFTVKFTLMFMLLLILANMWWILPTYGKIPEGFVEIEAWGGLDWVLWKSERASFLNIFRLTNFVGWGDGYRGKPTFAYANFFLENPIMVLVGFVFPLLAFSALLFKRNRDYCFFFAILVVTSMFLAKGLHPPLESVNRWLYLYVPGFWIFRSVEWFNHTIVLSYSFLIGVTVGNLYERTQNTLQRRKKAISRGILFFIILLIMVYPYPYWTGTAVHSGEAGGEAGYPYHVKVPQYYYSSAAYINNQTEDFRILSMPFLGLTYAQYTWGYGGGDVPVLTLFNKPVIDTTYGYDYTLQVLAIIKSMIYNDLTENITKILGLLNVKYVLLHYDTDWQFYGQPSPESLRPILEKQRGLNLDKYYGELAFYVVDEDFFIPKIYVPDMMVYLEGDLNDLFSLVLSADASQLQNAYIISDVLSDEQKNYVISQWSDSLDYYKVYIDNIQLTKQKYNTVVDVAAEAKPAIITFQKLNPTKYIVHVSASEPFFLIFSESYHRDWVAYINGEQIPSEQHFVANGYANAWYVNKTGTYNITLEFRPQKLFYVGSATSIITLIFCVLYISKNKIKALYSWYVKKK